MLSMWCHTFASGKKLYQIKTVPKKTVYDDKAVEVPRE